MKGTLVSVIMPTYNRENTLRRAIDSVLCQTYDHLELIIVDDGSTDNTLEIIQTYTDNRIKVICQEHSGANRARNTGIAHAKGKYIAFQDSDDEWVNNKLEVQVAFMRTKEYLACFSPYYLHDEAGITVIPEDYQTNEEYHSNLVCVLKCHNVVGTPTLLLKKETVSMLHGEMFDETLPRFQEYELLIRLVQMGDIGYIDIPLVNVYRVENSISMSRKNLYEAVGNIIKRHRNFLDLNSFLNSYVIENSEFEDISELLEGMKKIQDNAGMELTDLTAGMTAYLHNRLKYRNIALERLYQAALASLDKKQFVIYGMGGVASVFYEKIKRMGIRPESFLVTSIGKLEPKYVDDIPVCAAKDYMSKDILVMVCVSDKYQEEILDNLIKLGYSDICICQML